MLVAMESGALRRGGISAEGVENYRESTTIVQ
jgi:hypothetical protein